MIAQRDSIRNVEVWPDNWESACTFAAMSTQWRTGPAGPCGLDYGCLPDVLRMRGVPRSTWGEVFSDIRVMEETALEEIHKERK